MCQLVTNIRIKSCIARNAVYIIELAFCDALGSVSCILECCHNFFCFRPHPLVTQDSSHERLQWTVLLSVRDQHSQKNRLISKASECCESQERLQVKT